MSYTKVSEWQPAFDMPHNREQALDVLKAWSRADCMTFSAHRAARVYECLTCIAPKPLKAQIRCGGGFSWCFGVEEGWFGQFETSAEAEQAGFEYMLERRR